MGGNVKRFAFPLVAGAILLVTSIVSGVTFYGESTTLAAQQVKVDDLTAAVDEAQSTTDAVEMTISLTDSGADPARVARDTDTIGELVGQALTWDSQESYNEARASTMRIYGLAEDSTFMTSFLPVAPVNIDSQGNEYPYIDAAGLNSLVGDVQAKLLSVDAVKYSYMALVDVQAESSDGRGVAVNVATVFLTIDGEGALTDVRGFASTSKLRTSG